MKKRWTACVALILCASLAACGKSASNDETQTEQALPRQGILSQASAEVAGYERSRTNAPGSALETGDYEELSFGSLSELKSALLDGRVDWICLPLETARAVRGANSALTLTVVGTTTYYYSLATASSNEALCASLDGALDALEADGTLDALIEAWIADGGSYDDTTELPIFEDAETITLGVTGDLPPMDSVSDSGKPRGFSVAFAAALSEKLGVNVALSVVSAQDRVTALASGRIDAALWVYGCTADAYDQIGELRLTDPYYCAYEAILTKDYAYADALEALGVLTQPEPTQTSAK